MDGQACQKEKAVWTTQTRLPSPIKSYSERNKDGEGSKDISASEESPTNSTGLAGKEESEKKRSSIEKERSSYFPRVIHDVRISQFPP